MFHFLATNLSNLFEIKIMETTEFIIEYYTADQLLLKTIRGMDLASVAQYAAEEIKKKYGPFGSIKQIYQKPTELTPAQKIVLEVKHTGYLKLMMASKSEALDLKQEIYKELQKLGIRSDYLVISWCKNLTITKY